MKNICKLCGSVITGERVKAKGGVICRECCNALPPSVRESTTDFTPKQLGQLKKLVKPFPKGKWLWRSCGGFGLRPDSIVLNGLEYKLRDLRTVKLNFHPHGLGKESSVAVGFMTVVIETRSPHFLIEEEFLPGMTSARYAICGMDIFYTYPSAIEDIMVSLRKAINNGSFVIEEAKRQEERIKREEQIKRENRQKETARKKTDPHPETPFDAALRRFGLKLPFTREDLRKRRKEIIIRENLHPDNHPGVAGGDAKFKELQEAYQILEKFASG